MQGDSYKAHNHNVINEYSSIDRRFIELSDLNSEGVEIQTGVGNRSYTYFEIANSGGTETRPLNVAMLVCIRY